MGFNQMNDQDVLVVLDLAEFVKSLVDRGQIRDPVICYDDHGNIYKTKATSISAASLDFPNPRPAITEMDLEISFDF